MADTNPTTQQTQKEALAKSAEARKASQDKAVKMMEDVKPTPTQEENDLAKMGVDVVEKEPDGSPQEGGKDDKAEDKAAAAKPAVQSRQAPPPPPPRSTSGG